MVLIVWYKIVINGYRARVAQTDSSCYDNDNEWYKLEWTHCTAEAALESDLHPSHSHRNSRMSAQVRKYGRPKIIDIEIRNRIREKRPEIDRTIRKLSRKHRNLQTSVVLVVLSLPTCDDTGNTSCEHVFYHWAQ